MFYHAQHTRPITDCKRVCERSSSAAALLAAARAVNDLQAAGLRLASARQLVAGLNDNSATLSDIANFANTSNMSKRIRDNKLIRSINNYRVACESRSSSTQDSTCPLVMLLVCDVEQEGVFQRGIPFYVYIPL